MPDQITPRPAGLDALLDHVAANLPDDADDLFDEVAAELETPHDVTVHQIRYGTTDQPDVIATYTTLRAAQEHGEHARQVRYRHHTNLGWLPETPAADAPLRLYVTDLDGDVIATDWHIVPGMIRSTFTPVCGES